EDRIEHGEPAIDHLIPANWGDEKIARAGGGDIGNADCLVRFALLFLARRLEKLNRRRTAERLNPEAANGIDIPARGVSRRTAGGVRQDDDWKLKALRLVHRHQP